MAESGLDLSEEFPKPLTDDVVQAADVVITMGCGDACPIFPGKRYLDWVVDDPAGQPIEVCAGYATRSGRAWRRCSLSWAPARQAAEVAASGGTK
jgi:protein-tyrosine-phosphatase